MEQKLLKLAWFVALIMIGVFGAYFLDEILQPMETNTSVGELRTEMSNDGHRTYFLSTTTKQMYEISDIEYYHLRAGDPIKTFETHWFKARKGWTGKSFQNGNVLGYNTDGSARTGLLIIYLITIILGVLAMVTKRFEFRITIAFFILILAAFKYWFGEIL